MSSSTGWGELDLEGSRPWRGDQVAEEARVVAMEEEEEGIDHFDQLPDSMILIIFNQIEDMKALGWCCIISRRFYSLVPHVDYVIIHIDCIIFDDPAPSTIGGGAGDGTGMNKGRNVFSHRTRLILGGLIKPLQALGQILAPASSLSFAASRRAFASSSSSSYSSSEVSHHSPTKVLKNFKKIRCLRIELPASELGVDDDILLKWKADFGSTLDSCIILGASSVLSSSLSHPADDSIGSKYLRAMPGWHDPCPGGPCHAWHGWAVPAQAHHVPCRA